MTSIPIQRRSIYDAPPNTIILALKEYTDSFDDSIRRITIEECTCHECSCDAKLFNIKYMFCSYWSTGTYCVTSHSSIEKKNIYIPDSVHWIALAKDIGIWEKVKHCFIEFA